MRETCRLYKLLGHSQVGDRDDACVLQGKREKKCSLICMVSHYVGMMIYMTDLFVLD